MAIVTKPSNIYQEYENVYQLSVSELLLHPKVSIDTYFNNQLNWKTVFLVYEAPNSNQREMVEFYISEGSSTGLFEVTEFSRGSYQVKSLIIEDFDSGYLRLDREDIDFTTLDISLVLPPPNIDPGPPTLTFVNISPVIADASNNEVITLTFTGSEDLQNVSATIAGQSANISGSGTSWIATYMLMGTEPAGLVSFSINFEDIENNAGTTVTSTTNGSSCTIEYGEVSLSVVSITSTSGQNAVEGDTVSVSFTSSDPIQNITSTIAGKVASVSNTGGNDWEATYVLTSSETQGQASFTINYEDQFGNPQNQVTSVTDGSQVIIDTISPTLSPVTIGSNNVDPTIAESGDIITINFTSSETIESVIATISSNPATVTNLSGNNWKAEYTVQSGDPSGVVSFTIDFQDTSGNIGTQVITITSGQNVTIQQGDNSGILDLTYSNNTSSASKFNRGVRHVTQPDGKVIAYGDFTNYDSISGLNYLVRFNQDGTPDSSFNNNASLNKFISSGVGDVKVQNDGKIIAVGTFDYSPDGINTYSGTIRLNQDGTIDTNFMNNVYQQCSPSCVEIQSDGKILLGGVDSDYGGVVGRNSLVRINSDGTVDNSFCSNASDGGAFVDTFNNIPGNITKIKQLNDGSIFILGRFNDYRIGCPDHIAVLNQDGTLNTTISGNLDNNTYLFNGRDVCQDSNNNIYVVLGGTVANPLKFSSNGTRDVTFPNTQASSGGSYSLFIDSNDNIYVGGYFQGFAGIIGADYLVKLDTLGNLDTQFNQNASNGKFNSGIYRGISVDVNGDLIVSGNFSNYNGIVGLDKLIKLK